MYRENEIRVDTLPSDDFDAYLSVSKEIPALDATTLIHGDTVLDIGLSNVNVMLHVPAVVLNSGTIENWGIIPNVGSPDVIYDIYAHGVSPSVGRVQFEFYLEQASIARKNPMSTGISIVGGWYHASPHQILGKHLHNPKCFFPQSRISITTSLKPSPTSETHPDIK